MRNRIDHWCTVEPGNPNPRDHRFSGKLGEASFPTGTVDPQVGISLSPLNFNDGFSLAWVLGFRFRSRVLSHIVWKTGVMFHSQYEKWMNGPLLEVNAEDVEEEVWGKGWVKEGY